MILFDEGVWRGSNLMCPPADPWPGTFLLLSARPGGGVLVPQRRAWPVLASRPSSTPTSTPQALN